MVAMTARTAGIDPALVLRGSGLEVGTPPVPDEHVDVARYLDVWRRAMALIADPAFPLRAASAFQLEDHEVFGFLAMSCETLGQAYDRTAAYRALYCVGARWEIQPEADARTAVGRGPVLPRRQRRARRYPRGVREAHGVLWSCALKRPRAIW